MYPDNLWMSALKRWSSVYYNKPGAVLVRAGAVAGANISRDHGGQEVSTQDVQHCANTNRYAQPEYWDVTYTFRGQEHRLQMTANPGATVTVNERGEPRE